MINTKTGTALFVATVLASSTPSLAALVVGPPVVVATGGACLAAPAISTLVGADSIEVAWSDGSQDQVLGRHLDSSLVPTAASRVLLDAPAGASRYVLTGQAGAGFDLVVGLSDFSRPDDPRVAYHLQLDAAGDPTASPLRIDPPRGVVATTNGSGTVAVQVSRRLFGPPTCQSFTDVLATSYDAGGTVLHGPASIAQRASAAQVGTFLAEPTSGGSIVGWQTCQKLTGLVARRLDPRGVSVGKPINLPLPAPVANFLGGSAALATHGSDFAIAALTFKPSFKVGRAYVSADQGGKVFGPTQIAAPAGTTISGISDLAASSAGTYLLVFQVEVSSPHHFALEALELDAHGVPTGSPALLTTDAAENGRSASAAARTGGGWIVSWRAQSGADSDCSETVRSAVVAHS